MSLLAKAYARISPRLAHGPASALSTKAHAWLIRRTGGRIGTRFVGGGSLLVLRTTGRRSGRVRESPLLYVEEGDAFVVCAANAASSRPPAWWLNLQASPSTEALVGGEWRPVRARKATDAERERLWPRLQETYEGHDHYLKVAQRELPVVLLEPAAP